MKKKTADPEKLEALGGENEKQGRQAVIELNREAKKESEGKRHRVLDLLSGKAKTAGVKSYNQLLSELLGKRMMTADIPRTWKIKTYFDAVGVILELESPNERIFRSAFKPTGEAIYDLNAIDMYIERSQNTVERVEKEKNAISKKTN